MLWVIHRVKDGRVYSAAQHAVVEEGTVEEENIHLTFFCSIPCRSLTGSSSRCAVVRAAQATPRRRPDGVPLAHESVLTNITSSPNQRTTEEAARVVLDVRQELQTKALLRGRQNCQNTSEISYGMLAQPRVKGR